LRILIDIGHPAHVHLFKHFAHAMIHHGHQVHFTVREKEFEIALLNKEGFSYTSVGKHYKSKTGKIWGLVKFTFLTVITSLKFKPDIYLSHGSMYAALASFLLRKPNIALEDTGNWEQVRLYLPFTEAVLTSTSFPISYGEKQVYYEGFHELAYLHPCYFTPEKSILKELAIKEGEKYFILRFVSWDASHDKGHSGLSLKEKDQLVELLQQQGKVFISFENRLGAEFETNTFTLSPEKMHQALAFADLFVGEGATMASECAMLGTPAIYINSIEAGTIDDQEKYGLVYHFRNSNGILEKVQELINDNILKNKLKESRQKLLSEKINVTEFMVWFIENWPESFRIMKEDPDYQYNFKYATTFEYQ
jgi:uncharacterized protein